MTQATRPGYHYQKNAKRALIFANSWVNPPQFTDILGQTIRQPAEIGLDRAPGFSRYGMLFRFQPAQASNVLQEAGSESLDGAAKRTAKEIANLIVSEYRKRGWL